MHAPSVGVQQHACRAQADPYTPPHMPGGTMDLGDCGLVFKKILEVGGGTLAHVGVHEPSVGLHQHASREQADPYTPTYMPGGTMDLGECGLISKKILEVWWGDVGPRKYACT